MIKTLKLLDTNYSYIISNNSKALIVDPGESAPILKFLKNCNLKPVGILITHNHYDHIDGIKDIKEIYPSINIVDSQSKEPLFNDFEIEIMLTPGHTFDSCCFYLPSEKALITGDTLFTGLCGRLMGGTFNQFFTSLQSLKKIPGDTGVYPGHEYLKHSISFMKLLHIQHDFYSSIENREYPSLNTTIELEIKNNPFMTGDFDRFKYLRKLKG